MKGVAGTCVPSGKGFFQFMVDNMCTFRVAFTWGKILAMQIASACDNLCLCTAKQHLRAAPWLPWRSRLLRRPRACVPAHWTPRPAGQDRGASLGAGCPGSGGVGRPSRSAAVAGQHHRPAGRSAGPSQTRPRRLYGALRSGGMWGSAMLRRHARFPAHAIGAPAAMRSGRGWSRAAGG